MVSGDRPDQGMIASLFGKMPVPPASRSEPFSQQVREEAEIQKVTLLNGSELLHRVGRARRGTYGQQELLEELAPTPCHPHLDAAALRTAQSAHVFCPAHTPRGGAQPGRTRSP